MRTGSSVIRASAAAVAFMACLAPVVESQQTPAGGLRAGAAKVEITPKPSDLTIATDSIRDPLFARVIVVDDGRGCAVLGGLDLGGVSTALVNDVVTRASAATGCRPENVIVSATHTHSSNTQGLGQGPPTARTVADAIVEAARTAKSRLAPARLGYGQTNVDLNVNRDLFNSKLEWRQEPNPNGPSDKTLAVVAFLGADNVPIAVYMNYAMHPINFYLSGVISADFPGEASRYIEELFDNRTIAVFSQGASGDQNPRDFRSPTTFMGQRAALTQGRGPFDQTIGAPTLAPATSPSGFNAQQASTERQAIRAESLAAYKKSLARTGEYVHMLGSMLGSSAVRVMREAMRPVDSARIWAGQQGFACPGRIRNDADNPARENVFPGYKDGPDVNLKVGLLRIGDVHFVSVNGEIYSQIGCASRLKRRPARPSSSRWRTGRRTPATSIRTRPTATSPFKSSARV